MSLLWHPSWLFDLSFQLSYLAVAGMLIFTGPLVRWLVGELAGRPWWHWRTLLGGGAVASAAAQVLSLPLVASNFGRVPLLSPLVNVVAVPLAGLLVPLGFAASLLGLVWLPLAGVVNTVTELLASLLIVLAEGAATLPSLAWAEIAASGLFLLWDRCRGAGADRSRAAAALARTVAGRGGHARIVVAGAASRGSRDRLHRCRAGR